MPITGLSDRASLDPRFKEVGRLRKGAAKQGNRPGADLDYLRYVPDSQHLESAVVFEELYGPEPTELEVYFPFDQMERVFSSWREEYGQNRICKLRCDGARWHDWIEGDRHRHSEQGVECPKEYRDTENRCPLCPLAYSGRLSVILKPMWLKDQIGLITVMTSSINDIANLAAKLVQWEPLRGKPFRLWRETERIGVPIKGKRAARDSPLLHLELAKEWFLLEFHSSESRAYEQLSAPVHVALIGDGEHEPQRVYEETEPPPMDGDFTDEPPYAEAQDPGEPTVVEVPPEHTSGIVKLTFGKHKGKTLAQVWQEDETYLDWLSEHYDPQGDEQKEKFLAAVRAFVESKDNPTVVEAEVVEEEPSSSPGEHEWTKEEANELFAWTRNELVITDSDILKVLGVERISDYKGDPKAARVKIAAHLEKELAQAD
jgi:hypothetical protein